MNSQAIFQPGDKVLFSHCEGPISATVINLSSDGQKVNLKVKGWLGTTYEPIYKVKLA